MDNYCTHKWLAPDLAFFERMSRYSFTIHCIYCGKTLSLSGAEIRLFFEIA
jgi:hypothetical protein